MSKKFDGDAMSVNCNAIVIFAIYGQFGAIGKPDSGRMVLQLTIFFILQKMKTEVENL